MSLLKVDEVPRSVVAPVFCESVGNYRRVTIGQRFCQGRIVRDQDSRRAIRSERVGHLPDAVAKKKERVIVLQLAGSVIACSDGRFTCRRSCSTRMRVLAVIKALSLPPSV